MAEKKKPEGMTAKKRTKKQIEETLRRIEAEEERLWDLISDASQKQLDKVTVLIEQLSAMRVQLADLTQHCTEYGYSEKMINGGQILKVQSAESKMLDATRKTYVTSLKALESMLPSVDLKAVSEDEFETFKNNRPR